MKYITLIAAITFFGLTALTGCSKKSSSPSYSMKATVGSTSVNASACIAAVVANTLGISGSTVSGSVGGPPQINISISNWTGGTGTFAIGTISDNVFAQYISATGATASLSQSGSVTLSSVSSTVISGTFNFTCTNGTVVSSGTFTAQRM